VAVCAPLRLRSGLDSGVEQSVAERQHLCGKAPACMRDAGQHSRNQEPCGNVPQARRRGVAEEEAAQMRQGLHHTVPARGCWKQQRKQPQLQQPCWPRQRRHTAPAAQASSEHCCCTFDRCVLIVVAFMTRVSGSHSLLQPFTC
jgi:hypothetical protein